MPSPCRCVWFALAPGECQMRASPGPEHAGAMLRRPQGGMPGAERLRDSAALMRMLGAQRDSGRLWSAICAAPAVVLEGKGLLAGKTATCHPAFTQQLKDQRCACTLVSGNPDALAQAGMPCARGLAGF